MMLEFFVKSKFEILKKYVKGKESGVMWEKKEEERIKHNIDGPWGGDCNLPYNV